MEIPEPKPFRLISSLSSEKRESREKKYQNLKSKTFSLSQNGKVIDRFHPELIEEDFEDTYELFPESDRDISISDDIKPEIIKKVIRYLYFLEIDTVEYYMVPNLLRLAFFMKLYDLCQKIKEFLMESVSDPNNIIFVRKEAYDFINDFLEDGGFFVEDLIQKCEETLLRMNFEEYMSIFTSDFLKTHKSHIENILHRGVKLMKKNQISIEKIIDFLKLLKDSVVESLRGKDSEFDVLKYYKEIIENLELNNEKSIVFEEFLKELTGKKECHVVMNFINEKKMAQMQNEIKLKEEKLKESQRLIDQIKFDQIQQELRLKDEKLSQMEAEIEILKKNSILDKKKIEKKAKNSILKKKIEKKAKNSPSLIKIKLKKALKIIKQCS